MSKIHQIVVLFVLSYFGFSNALTGPSHGKIVVCYLGAWSVYRPDRGSFTIEHIDPNLCTHLVYSFAGLDVLSDGIKSLDPWQDLKENWGKDGYGRITALKRKFSHLKVNLAIGGWNEGSANYSALVADPHRRGRFVKNALEFIRKYDFDGLDLDWEFPGKRGGKPEDKTNFLLLVKELKSAFRKHDLMLTAALGAGKDTIDTAYDIEALSIYLDYMHLMCYDYHGAWDEKAGSNAPLRSLETINSVEYTVEYLLKMGAPPSKLILGIPLYGRTFLLKNPAELKLTDFGKLASRTATQKIGFQGPYTRENGFMGYNEICLELLQNSTQNNKWTKYWDSQTRTPYAVHGDRLISYDDKASVAEKVRFAVEKGLGGAMVWSIDTDDFRGDCAESVEAHGSSAVSDLEANSAATLVGAASDGHYENFPILRALNRAIVLALDDIEREKENTIIHGHAEHTGSEDNKGVGVVSEKWNFGNLVIIAFGCYFLGF